MRYILLISGILLFCHTFAQNRVTFSVQEESGEPLIGASVVIEGTTNGTITNTEGLATFDDLHDGKYEFVISFVGYEEKEVTLSFPEDNNKTIEIELEAGEELQEIVIATTRSSRTIQDVPTRIEAITGEELGENAAMNSSNVGMLLRETTGVQMQQTSLSSGNMSIRIQGLDGRYTQILKDGFPLYGGFAGGLSIMQIPPLDLKQVELIKGSSSTLYGGGAIAGLVNLISITPEDDPVLDVMFNQTSAMGTTANLFYTQKYGKTGLTFYSAVSKQKAYDPDDDGFSNLPKAKTYNFNPKFYYYINSNTELSLGLNTAFDTRTGGDTEVLKGNESGEHVFFEENNSDRYSTQLAFRNTKEDRTISFKNSISYFQRELTVPAYTFDGNQISNFTEAMYILHKNSDTDWQFGINHYLEKFAEETTGSSPVRDYSHNTVGGFIQNTTDLSDKLVVEAGLRTDYNTDYGTFVLPRLSILFKASNKLSSRIGGAMGYKLPTIFTEDAERLYFRGIQPLSNDMVDVETSIGGNFDINYKTALWDEITFSINQLFFLTQLKNALVLREDDNSNLAYFESADGNVLSSGIETNIKLSYSDFKLYMDYTLINTQLKYDNINNQKPLTPKHNLGFALMYEIEEKWTAGYELYYTGNQFDNSYNEKSDYWVMGFMLMRIFEKFSVFINFENFTNTHQGEFEALVLPPVNNPTFRDIWAPTDGFVFNGGVKFSIF
ncbi:TonB-dependent receptor [Sunxiuqinia sp. A32]|uniref:TonB-dependent receptor n=1 Tax=Sunxiuqinia sp. A32 TaxID=3461496 RepID=UPI0040454C8A